MSNFPFNTDTYEYREKVNGSPLTYKEALALADKILFWHTSNDTADFSQSGDGFDHDMILLALGLVEYLSDPNAIKRAILVGYKTKETIETVLNSKDGVVPKWDNIKIMLKRFLGKR